MLWIGATQNGDVMLSQIASHSTVCLAAYADPQQRNIKFRVTCLLWGESTSDWWIPRTNGQ